jgi:hypothetical protein
MILFMGNTKFETGEPEKGTSFGKSRLDWAFRRATFLGSLTANSANSVLFADCEGEFKALGAPRAHAVAYVE